MKKFHFLTAVFLSALLSSCSMLSKNEKQEISVTLDTKPLAKYAKILFSEGSESIEVPRQEPEPEEIYVLNDFSFTVKVTLSGDFTEDLVKEKTIDFEKVISKPEKISFKFENLEYIQGSTAKLKSEVFITPKEESNITVSNSLFIAENEQTLVEGNNIIPLSMDYTTPAWPTDGILSLLPEMEDYWFYTEEKPEADYYEWRIYNKSLKCDDDESIEYEEVMNNLYGDNYDKLLELFNLPEGSGIEFGPCFEDSCIIFTVQLFPYEESDTPQDPVPEYPKEDDPAINNPKEPVEEIQDGIKMNFYFKTSDDISFTPDNVSALKEGIVTAVPSALFDMNNYYVTYTNLETKQAGNFNEKYIKLDPGIYKLEVNVGGKFSVIKEEVEITEETSSLDIAFEMDNVQTSDSSSNTALAFADYIPEPYSLDSYDAKAEGLSEGTSYLIHEKVSKDTLIVYDNCTYGEYLYTFEFYDESEIIINSLETKVYCWPGLTTDWFFGPEDLVNENHELIIKPSDDYLNSKKEKDDNYTGGENMKIDSIETFPENETVTLNP